MDLKLSEAHLLPVIILDAPHPLCTWCYQSGSRPFGEDFQETITKFIVCSYPHPVVPDRNVWGLFGVLEGADKMLKIGWQLTEYPKPKLVLNCCTKDEFDVELPLSTSRDDFVTYGLLITEKNFTFNRLTELITTHGLLTYLVANVAPKTKSEEYFSTCILTLLSVLLRNQHIDSSAIPKMAARISCIWAHNKDGRATSLGAFTPEPVNLSSSLASEL